MPKGSACGGKSSRRTPRKRLWASSRRHCYERPEERNTAGETGLKGVLATIILKTRRRSIFGYSCGLADRGVRLDEAAPTVGGPRAAMDPNNAAYLDSLGWIILQNRHLTQAETLPRKAVDRDSHDPCTMLSHMGGRLAPKADMPITAAVDGGRKKNRAEVGIALVRDDEFEEDKVTETGAKDFQRDAPPPQRSLNRRRTRR